MKKIAAITLAALFTVSAVACTVSPDRLAEFIKTKEDLIENVQDYQDYQELLQSKKDNNEITDSEQDFIDNINEAVKEAIEEDHTQEEREDLGDAEQEPVTQEEEMPDQDNKGSVETLVEEHVEGEDVEEESDQENDHEEDRKEENNEKDIPEIRDGFEDGKGKEKDDLISVGDQQADGYDFDYETVRDASNAFSSSSVSVIKSKASLKSLIGRKNINIDKYNDSFFESHELLVFHVGATSGSVQFKVDSVFRASENEIKIVGSRVSPEIGTCDMAGWYVFVSVPAGTVQSGDSISCNLLSGFIGDAEI